MYMYLSYSVQNLVVNSLSRGSREHTTRTTEPHDELHASTDLDSPEPVDQEGERVYIECPTQEDQNKTPHNQTNFK